MRTVGSLGRFNHHLHRLRIDGSHSHNDSRQRKSLDENKELLHGVPPRRSGNLRWVQSTDALRRVHNGHRGGEQGEAEGKEHEYLFHDTICAMTVVAAMPVVNAKVSAKTRKIFFMALPSLLVRLPKPATSLRDGHHVLKLFRPVAAAEISLLSGKCSPRTPNKNYGFLFFICLILNS
jgi:hypothetical protein